MYIGFHQEKKYKGYRFKTSQFSTIVAGILNIQIIWGKNWQIQQRKEIRSFFCDYCCWNIQTFKSSEVKIWRNRQIEEYLSFFTSPHSLSHPIPSSVMYCEFQILLNHLVIKFSIMDPVILYFQISIKNRNICAIVSQKLQNTDTFVAKITISAHPNFVHFLGLFVQGVF